MADAMVEEVRRFNRTVSERIGALNDHFLGGERPLGEARSRGVVLTSRHEVCNSCEREW